MVEKEETLDNEIKILSDIHHPHVVQMKAIFDTEETLFIVMELMLGGELYEEIVRRKSFSEKDASYIMKQLFSALSYLHKKGIVHRDLKLENLLITEPNSLDIKLADFGLSKIVAGDALTTACGTPFYVAPDILLGTGYDSAVDMWACGILLYVLLSGRLPFAADSDAELFKLIIDGDLVWKSPQFDTVSDEARDLISNLIVVEPRDRFTADEAIQHVFIKENNRNTPLHASFLDNLKNVSALSKASIEKAKKKTPGKSSSLDDLDSDDEDDDFD
jgi:calcium/calmodulin-dependent protein kinase I